MAYARKQQNYKTMELIKKEGYGVQALKVTIEFGDAVKIAVLLDNLDRYEKQLDAHNAWMEEASKHAEGKWNKETGLWEENEWHKTHPEPIDPNADPSWNPQDFIVKARAILKKLTFVELSESNIFDEEVVAEEPRKAYK